MANVSSQALISHIVQRTKQDIDFLTLHGVLSHADRSLINEKLESASNNSVVAASPNANVNRESSVSNALSNLSISNPTAAATGGQAGPPPAAPKPVPNVAPAAVVIRAKALWDYQASQADDLAFTKGQVIEIVKKENGDWWRGRLDGREGIFPCNHVEELPPQLGAPTSTAGRAVPPPPPALSPVPAPTPPMYTTSPPYNHYSNGGNPVPNQYPAYPQPQGPYPPQQAYGDYKPQAPEPQQQVVVEPPKKGRFGFGGGNGGGGGNGMGKVLATSLVGGVGFGAGSAAAGELVHAIF